jgi:pyruvate dehydrogenase E1 component alpha subunit
MNLAALWQLPVLFICENNLYAMGTALSRHQAQIDIAKKADAYGMKSATVDGMNVMEVGEAVSRAAKFVRSERRPFLLVAETYRFRAHSMYDPDLYRSKDEIEEWKERCPIAGYARVLRADGVIDDTQLANIEAQVKDEIQSAIAFAEDGSVEPVQDLLRDLYTPSG